MIYYIYSILIDIMAVFWGYLRVQFPSSSTINMRILSFFWRSVGVRVMRYPFNAPDLRVLVDLTSTNNISPCSLIPIKSHGPKREKLSKT